MKGFHWPLLLLCLLAWSSLAEARSTELVVSLALSSDLLPTRICVRATKLGKQFTDSALPTLEELAPGEARFIRTSTPACANGGSVCDKCSNPRPASGGVVCWLAEGEDAKQPKRDLQLQLDGAGISSLEVAGTDILMKAEVPDEQPPRIRSLGGAYYPTFAQVVSNSGTLALGLRNRCVQRFLSFSTDPLPSGANDEATFTTTMQPIPVPYDRQAPAVLAVPEEGSVNRVQLTRGSTSYSGTFSYPSNGPVELLVTQFSFTWQKSPFVLGRREVDSPTLTSKSSPPRKPATPAELKDARERECPRVWLVRPGIECLPPKAIPSKPAMIDQAASDECQYECSKLPPIEFPTRVRFELKPPRQAKTKDLLKWEEDLRFPNANFTSIPPGEERRIYLIWPGEKSEPGREWDALELTGPDGMAHQLEQQTDNLPIAGLQSPATFSYRYLGRGPYRGGTLLANGDLLIVPAPSATRQPAVLGVMLHGGTLFRHGLEARQWSPTLDAELVGLVLARLELTLSGTFTFQPSQEKVQGAPDRWSSSPQLRFLLGAGWRWRIWTGCYFALGMGAGFATRAFESDWSRSKPWFTSSLRARFGYEVSRALAFEPFVTFWYPERYVVQSQDAAGPLDPKLLTTYSISMGVGMQWSDVF